MSVTSIMLGAPDAELREHRLINIHRHIQTRAIHRPQPARERLGNHRLRASPLRTAQTDSRWIKRIAHASGTRRPRPGSHILLERRRIQLHGPLKDPGPRLSAPSNPLRASPRLRGECTWPGPRRRLKPPPAPPASPPRTSHPPGSPS
jgi:hypothetical protein